MDILKEASNFTGKEISKLTQKDIYQAMGRFERSLAVSRQPKKDCSLCEPILRKAA